MRSVGYLQPVVAPWTLIMDGGTLVHLHARFDQVVSKVEQISTAVDANRDSFLTHRVPVERV